jgi:hypothetical protein
MKYNKRDRVTLLVHYRNHRLGRVVALCVQRKNGEYNDMKRSLMGVHTPNSILVVYAARRLQVHLTKSDNYLKARVTALRSWQWLCIEVHGTSPWRVHVWPGNKDPDLQKSKNSVYRIERRNLV